MLEMLSDLFGSVLSYWTYWLPVLTFAIGVAGGWSIREDETQKQLTRLAKHVQIPDGWERGAVDAPLDGACMSREEMAQASLVIRSPFSHGSGVCISSEGLVLTNAHVVEDAPVVEVEGESGSYLGVVVKVHVERDVALLKLGTTNLKPVRIAAEEPTVGDDLFVAGTPLRLENANMLTKGVVSKIGLLDRQRYIHMDAAIAPGNSGGPVFNHTGSLIGLSVAIQTDSDGTRTHIGLAIPIDEIVQTLKLVGSAQADSAEPHASSA